jgi:hypothetical protein
VYPDGRLRIADAPAIVLALTIELDAPTIPSEACGHFDQQMVRGLTGEPRRLRRADSWANQRETNVADADEAQCLA